MKEEVTTDNMEIQKLQREPEPFYAKKNQTTQKKWTNFRKRVITCYDLGRNI